MFPIRLALVLILAALAGLAACSQDLVARVKAWRPEQLSGASMGAAMHRYPYFSSVVWDSYAKDGQTTVVEATGEFDRAGLGIACPPVYNQDAKRAYRAFLVLRVEVADATAAPVLASGVIRTYDARGYYFESDVSETALAGLAAGDNLLDCVTLYAKTTMEGM